MKKTYHLLEVDSCGGENPYRPSTMFVAGKGERAYDKSVLFLFL
jgi:hypothetical protein